MSGTAYANTSLPSGKLQVATADRRGGTGPLAQAFRLEYGFNGIGNLSSAVESVTWPTATSRTSRYEPVRYSTDAEAKDKVAAIRHTGSGAAPLPAAGSTAYAYGLQGHLLGVTRNGVEAERLWYGPTGELVSRQVGTKFTFYVGEYMSITASGQAGCSGTGCAPQAGTVEVDAHVLLAGTRIASVKPSRTIYYYRSRLGTVVATSLGGGVAGAQYRYDPYGKVQVALNETAATASELGYTNALRLTGELWYLKARVYDAGARVFLQADQVDRYRYAYVWGDPVNLRDPTGLEPEEERGAQSGSIHAAGTIRLQYHVDGLAIATFKDADGKVLAQQFVDVSSLAEKDKLRQVVTGLAKEAGVADASWDGTVRVSLKGCGDCHADSAPATVLRDRSYRGNEASIFIGTMLIGGFGQMVLEAGGAALAGALSRGVTAARGGLAAAAGGAVRYGPVNPGPLPDAVANAFRSGSYTANTLGEATTLYRVHGGTAGPLGGFWTRTPPAGPLQSRIDLALAPQWGNTATQVTRINVPAGITIYEGAAAAQGGLVGGGSQVFIPRVDPSWVLP